MREKIEPVKYIVDIAEEAMKLLTKMLNFAAKNKVALKDNAY